MNKNIIAFLLCSMAAVACKKTEDGHNHDEQELITQVLLTFTDTSGVAPNVQAQFNDPDGPGGLPPVRFDSIVLHPNTVYRCNLSLANTSATPPVDLTSEIVKEAKEHLFCYTAPLGLTINYADTDGSLPLGLSTYWKTDSSSVTGTLRLQLKHQPGIKNGDCNIGETDIYLNFNYKQR